MCNCEPYYLRECRSSSYPFYLAGRVFRVSVPYYLALSLRLDSSEIRDDSSHNPLPLTV